MKWLVRKSGELARGAEGHGLTSLAPAKGSLGSGAGSSGRCRLEGPVGQDPLGELLLGLGEAGTCPPVLRMDLGKREAASA